MGLIGLLIIAAIAGIAIAVQGQLMGSIDRTVGTLSSVFITYGMGGLLAAIIWVAGRGSLEGAREIPWYAWSAGAMGLVIVGAIGFATPRLGLSRAIIVIVAAQLLTAVIVDQFGLFGAPQRSVDLVRGLGVLLTMGGVWLVVRG